MLLLAEQFYANMSRLADLTCLHNNFPESFLPLTGTVLSHQSLFCTYAMCSITGLDICIVLHTHCCLRAGRCSYVSVLDAVQLTADGPADHSKA